MYEFESYVNTITDGLGLNMKKKEELAEEFKDHLESLQSEFIKNGFSESESTKRAIERFGESSYIKKKLYKSLLSFRNSGNVIFGAVITLILLIFCFLPMTGYTMAYRDHYSAIGGSSLLFTDKWHMVECIFIFIPIGYFFPVIWNKACKALSLSLIFSALGILTGGCFSLVLENSINVGCVLTYFVSGLLGGMAGYVVLICVNKLNMLIKNERVTSSN